MVTPSPNSTDGYLRSRTVELLRHEMGHYVIGRHLGFTHGDVSISISRDRQSHSAGAAIRLASAIDDISMLRRYLERRVIVLYAGACAEALRNGRVDPAKAAQLIKNPPRGAEGTMR